MIGGVGGVTVLGMICGGSALETPVPSYYIFSFSLSFFFYPIVTTKHPHGKNIIIFSLHL